MNFLAMGYSAFAINFFSDEGSELRDRSIRMAIKFAIFTLP